MVKTKSTKINLRIKDSLWVEIALISKNGGKNLTSAIETSLERYFLLLQNAFREARKEFSKEEKAFIMEMLNGVHYDSTSDGYRQLWIRAEEMIKYEELDKKWKVDGVLLVEKLRNLSADKCLAIVDRVERYWQSQTDGGDGDVWLAFDSLT